jgi:glycerophosphoryl diester phosphodiesterase
MQVIGHRGAADLAPENTWAGFNLALEIGVDAIETDVQATSDGRLVLLHDERLERTTDGSGLLRETSWAVVRDLDAGAWFDGRYRGAHVPTLDETLERYGKRTHWVLEIKQPGIELQVMERVCAHRSCAHGTCGGVTLTSFDWPTVQRIKAHYPGVRVGFLTRDVSAQSVARVVAAGLDQFCPPADALSAERVAGWKALGLEVRAWGIRDQALMWKAIHSGVDGMTVNFPHVLLAALGRKSGAAARG